jgi:tRNA uridine 5-carboxymethylaminomethyl modification enzyme
LIGGDFEALEKLDSRVASLDRPTKEQLARDSIYASYISRQSVDITAMRRDEETAIPPDFDYAGLIGLSSELREKLCRLRPVNMAQASRIGGMTPAALTYILAGLRSAEKRRA